MYEKPELKVIEISDEDIIQTSTGLGKGGIGGDGVNEPIEWSSFSLRSQSDATGDIFQK